MGAKKKRENWGGKDLKEKTEDRKIMYSVDKGPS